MAISTTVFVDNLPPGSIIMWYGDPKDVPLGWAICDGQNATPNLQNKFIVGAGGLYLLKSEGGKDKVALTSQEMPVHNHEATIEQNGSHNHQVQLNQANYDATASGRGAVEPYSGNYTADTKYAGSHSHLIKINSTGGGAPHENLPPYYALYFIMKVPPKKNTP